MIETIGLTQGAQRQVTRFLFFPASQDFLPPVSGSFHIGFGRFMPAEFSKITGQKRPLGKDRLLRFESFFEAMEKVGNSRKEVKTEVGSFKIRKR